MALRFLAGRRLTRAAAAVLFLAGTVFLPALHQAFHHLDHDHSGGGIRFHHAAGQANAGAPAASHRHAGGLRHTHAEEPPPSHHGRAPAKSLPAPEPPDPGDSDPAHGDGSLAHSAFALGEEAAVSTSNVSEPLPAAPAETLADLSAPRPGYFRAPAVRGPPAA